MTNYMTIDFMKKHIRLLYLIITFMALVSPTFVSAVENTPKTSGSIEQYRASIRLIGRESSQKAIALMRREGSSPESFHWSSLGSSLKDSESLIMGSLGAVRLREIIGGGCSNEKISAEYASFVALISELLKLKQKSLSELENEWSPSDKKPIQDAQSILVNVINALLSSGRFDFDCMSERNQQLKQK
jgi:hypothetical protein